MAKRREVRAPGMATAERSPGFPASVTHAPSGYLAAPRGKEWLCENPEDATPMDEALSQQLSNYRALVKRASDVLGSAELAAVWLSSPNPSLDGDIPLQILGRENYSREAIEKYLEPIFRRIEFGIYA